MKKSFNLKKKDNIVFGLIFCVLFLFIAFYPLNSQETVRLWSIFLSLFFLVITIIKPNLLSFLNKLWIQLGTLLGKIISPIVMGLVFFFVITPTGILVRILKKDILGLNRSESSYWITRKEKIQNMKKQF
jgi:cell division protein FtsW (lipid II flippase)